MNIYSINSKFPTFDLNVDFISSLLDRFKWVMIPWFDMQIWNAQFGTENVRDAR